jgi:hypothetical protein
MTVKDVAFLLKLDPERIGLIVIDGVQSEMDSLVPPNCRLCFFPPISGGSCGQRSRVQMCRVQGLKEN